MVNLILPGIFLEVPVQLPSVAGGDDLALGTAAEHLVCADLLISGYRAYRTDQVCAYDVAVEAGEAIIRVQVKATREPRSVPGGRGVAHMWHVRRAGKGGRRTYGEGEFDMLALVALDCRKIAYLPPSAAKQTIHIRQDNRGGRVLNDRRVSRTFEDATFSAALSEVLLRHGQRAERRSARHRIPSRGGAGALREKLADPLSAAG